jgi:hypothetical protein
MSFLSNLFSGETPEQRELMKRREGVDVLQTYVAQKELDFATLRGELQSFRVVYFKKLGDLYREHDALKAQIALLQAAMQSQEAGLLQAAVEAAEQAKATQDEIDEQAKTQAKADAGGHDAAEPAPFKPSAELKAAYRQAVKLMHPDRATNEQDQAYRNGMMAQVNVAYERMDLYGLAKLVLEFKAEDDIGGGIGRELVLLIRQESKLRERLAEIDREIEELSRDTMLQLRRQVTVAQDEGRDLLAELASKLNQDITTLKTQARELQALVDDAELDRLARVVAGETQTSMDKDRQGATGSHIHRTDRGDFVRSKSELVISNVFHALGMDYKYEMKITGRHTGGKMLPDFVFVTASDELIVWEHLGMLDKPEYKERWRVKQQWYEDNDFVVGVNFFVSRDQLNGSLDSHVLRKQALLVRSML